MGTVGITERTISGLHDYLLNEVLFRYTAPPGTAADLGAGSGALAVRLHRRGWNVVAIDIEAPGYQANVPFVEWNLDQPQWPDGIGAHCFDLVTAAEVIEHLENPTGFLRTVCRLLAADGVAIITTPNLENLPARLKYLIRGKLRMMDEHGDGTHISPIFGDLFTHRLLPRAGLTVAGHHFYPPDGYGAMRPTLSWGAAQVARLFPGRVLLGDVHIWVLQALKR